MYTRVCRGAHPCFQSLSEPCTQKDKEDRQQYEEDWPVRCQYCFAYALKASSHHELPTGGLDAGVSKPQWSEQPLCLSVFSMCCNHGSLCQARPIPGRYYLRAHSPAWWCLWREGKLLWRACWWREAVTCDKMMSSPGKSPQARHRSVISLVLIGGCTLPFLSLLEGIIYDLDITLLLTCWHFCFNNF